MAKQARRRSTRIMLAGLGFLSLGVSIIGIVLPGIPTTGPVLLAAYFFSRSSERFDQWLVGHRLFGPIVRDWRAGLGFTARSKVLSIIAIAATFSITVGFAVSNSTVRVGLVMLALAISTYILRLPTKVSETPA
ncbi:MAG: YbaN family protein [Acidimicrobiia bacterium]|nr:YbaN family protein [Acidimicrobiia bacterium]